MTWAKLSDKLWSHPKVVGLPLPALRLWLFGLSWASGHETDGHIPRAVLPIIFGTPKLAAALVSARLWETADGGWQIHNFTRYNPTRAELDEKRAATAERVAAFRVAKKRTGNATGNAVTNSVGNTSPDPTRPDTDQPTTPDQDLSGTQRPPPPPAELPAVPPDDRETPMPLDWQPHPAAVAELARGLNAPESAVRAAAEEFRAYWLLGGGAGKARRDWQRGFREHCRRSNAAGRLGDAPVLPSARRGRPDPLADQLEADRAAGVDARRWLVSTPAPTPKEPPPC